VLGGSTVVSLATVFLVGQAMKKEKTGARGSAGYFSTLPKNPKS
jgi:hypothetical protein